MFNLDSSRNNIVAGGCTNPGSQSQSIVVTVKKTVDHAQRYYKQIQSGDAKAVIIEMLAKEVILSKSDGCWGSLKK